MDTSLVNQLEKLKNGLIPRMNVMQGMTQKLVIRCRAHKIRSADKILILWKDGRGMNILGKKQNRLVEGKRVLLWAKKKYMSEPDELTTY